MTKHSLIKKTFLLLDFKIIFVYVHECACAKLKILLSHNKKYSHSFNNIWDFLFSIKEVEGGSYRSKALTDLSRYVCSPPLQKPS